MISVEKNVIVNEEEIYNAVYDLFQKDAFEIWSVAGHGLIHPFGKIEANCEIYPLQYNARYPLSLKVTIDLARLIKLPQWGSRSKLLSHHMVGVRHAEKIKDYPIQVKIAWNETLSNVRFSKSIIFDEDSEMMSMKELSGRAVTRILHENELDVWIKDLAEAKYSKEGLGIVDIIENIDSTSQWRYIDGQLSNVVTMHHWSYHFSLSDAGLEIDFEHDKAIDLSRLSLSEHDSIINILHRCVCIPISELNIDSKDINPVINLIKQHHLNAV